MNNRKQRHASRFRRVRCLLATVFLCTTPLDQGYGNDFPFLFESEGKTTSFALRPLPNSLFPGLAWDDSAGSFFDSPAHENLQILASAPDRRLRTWIRGFGSWSTVEKSDLRSSDLKAQSHGISFGLDKQFSRRFLFGGAVGANRSSLKQKRRQNNFGNESVESIYGSVYFRSTFDRLFFDLESGLGVNDVSYSSKSSLLQWHFRGETGTWWEHGLGNVEPYCGIQYFGLDDPNGVENKTTLTVGLRYSWETIGVYAVTTPRCYVGVLHELGSRKLFSVSQFVDSPTVYQVPGYEIAETRIFCGGGFTSALGSSLDLYLRYTAEIASNYTLHTILLGMNWNY